MRIMYSLMLTTISTALLPSLASAQLGSDSLKPGVITQVSVDDSNLRIFGRQLTRSGRLNAYVSDESSADIVEVSIIEEGAGSVLIELPDDLNPGSEYLVGFGSSKRLLRSTATFALESDFTDDEENVSLGRHALESITTGFNNTASGHRALASNTNGYANTASGSQSLFANIGGYENTAVGSQAMYANTDGYENTAVGHYSLRQNTTGYHNTAVGQDSLFNNTTGTKNTAAGFGSLGLNESGDFNTAIGLGALRKNVEGNSNTASGYRALHNNEGSFNTASGENALYSNTTGGDNTASGSDALFSNTNGVENTASGAAALISNTTGVKNTAVGLSALESNITGNENTAIGARANVASDDLENATVIGFRAIVDASNKVRIGNSAVTVIEGQVPFTSSSDKRLKEDIQNVERGLELINDLTPVSYKRLNNESGTVEMGLLAQDVAATLAKYGLNDSGMVHQANKDAYMSLRYNDLLAPMIKAIQELSDQSELKDELIAQLEHRLELQQDNLEAQQNELFALVKTQQKQIASLQRLLDSDFMAASD